MATFIIIIHLTIIVKLNESMLSLLSQVLTIRERRWFESIPTQLENLFLTQTKAHLRQGSLRSPLVQFRTNSWVQSAPHPQRFYQSARKIGTRTHPWTHAIGSPHILTTNHGAHFHLPGLGLSWATRLRGRNGLSGQLSARHTFNLTWGRTMNRSLTNTDRDK